jgi:hypothetical protein
MIPRYRIVQHRIEAELLELDLAALKAARAYEQAQREEQQATFQPEGR